MLVFMLVFVGQMDRGCTMYVHNTIQRLLLLLQYVMFMNLNLYSEIFRLAFVEWVQSK